MTKQRSKKRRCVAFSSFLIGGVALGVCWLSVVQSTDLNAHFNEQIVNCKFSIGSLALFLLRGAVVALPR